MKRTLITKSKPPAQGGGRFLKRESTLEFITTGCAILDCVLGGGWPLGRIANVVGDKSTGKTLLGIEATANFARQYPKGFIRYNEVEAAFDRPYAQALGLPIDRVDFAENCFTVEDFYTDLKKAIERSKKEEQPGLYILDSLDALSDRAELESDIDKGTYGAAKAKKMSELFRRLVQQAAQSKLSIIIISQVRDAIGVTFGDKKTRSGGHALDFYASQVVYLAHLKSLTRTIKGVIRPTGVRIRAKVKKNKINLPQRECEFDIRFGFGIDDIAANLNWMEKESPNTLKELDIKADAINRFLRAAEDAPPDEYVTLRDKIAAHTATAWMAVEEEFMPTRSKY